MTRKGIIRISEEASKSLMTRFRRAISRSLPEKIPARVVEAWIKKPEELQKFLSRLAKRPDHRMVRFSDKTFDLGDGWIFTVEEFLELKVDNFISPDEILIRGGHHPADFKYLGKRPKLGTRKEGVVIGRLNRNGNHEDVMELIAKPNCPLGGSGAWVMEAYLKARPHYDGKGLIGFPDFKTSRWRLRNGESVYFPNLWNDGRDWNRRLNRVRDEWNVEDRTCLLLRSRG